VVEQPRNDHTVMYYMLPTQAAPPQPKATAKPEPKKDWTAWECGGKATYRASNKVWKTGKNQKQGGFPSGGKLPLALKGCASCLPDGSRLCFDYNTSGCDKAQPGEACDKGYHLCATKGCGEKHSHAACPHE
jgi:hypothetical protein